MISCLQNRVWYINHTLAKTIDPQRLADLSNSHFALEKRHCSELLAGETVIHIRYQPDLLARLQARIDRETDRVLLEDIRIRLVEIGYAMILISFSYLQPFQFPDLEKNIHQVVSRCFNEEMSALEQVIDLLAAAGCLALSRHYHFGVTRDLAEHDLHSKQRSYLYNCHYVFIDEADLFHQQFADRDKQHKMYMDQPVEVFALIDTHWFWSVRSADYSEALIDTLLYPNFLALIESQLYANAIYCYTGYLELIIRGQKHQVDILREVVNTNNAKLLRIKMMRPMLRSYQISHIEHHHQFNMAHKIDLYKTAFNDLKHAVDGHDTMTAQRNDKLVQMILLVFTLLTIYSVVYDIFTFITGNIEQPSVNTLATAILMVVTLVLALVLLIVSRTMRGVTRL